jgi:NAD(P)-dependent dehydrogenase (short-subunit alcohol dehydrogenase family)
MNSAWITGTSSGLGEGFARVLLNTHQVTGFSRRPAPIKHSHYRHFSLNLQDAYSIPRVIEEAITEEPLDLLILNAGILGPIRDLYGTPLPEIEKTMMVNVWANKIIIDTLLSLEEQGRLRGPSHILAISSGASLNGARGWNAYSISKAALNMMIQLYAAERPDKKWISLAPGLVQTAMQDTLAEKDPERFPALKRLIAARGTDAMPDGITAARRIIDQLERIFEAPNGSYVDIRKI